MRQEYFLMFGVHTQLLTDSSSDFAVVSKVFGGAGQLVKGVILQSIYLFDTPVFTF